MIAFMRGALIAMGGLLAVAGCTFDDNRAHLLCVEAADCPTGMTCVAELCRPEPDGALPVDAAPPRDATQPRDRGLPIDMRPIQDAAPPVDQRVVDARPPIDQAPPPEPEPQPAPQPAPQPEPAPQPVPQPEPEPPPLPGVPCGPVGFRCVEASADAPLRQEDPDRSLGAVPGAPLELARGDRMNEERRDILLRFDFQPPPALDSLEIILTGIGDLERLFPREELEEQPEGPFPVSVAVISTPWEEGLVSWSTVLNAVGVVNTAGRAERDQLYLPIEPIITDLSADGVSLRILLRREARMPFYQRETPGQDPPRLRFRIP